MNRFGAIGEKGAAALEFALVAPVLFVMLLGLFDLGHKYYAVSVLQGAVQKAARDATLENGPVTINDLDAAVASSIKQIVGDKAKFSSERLSYANFSDVGDPEFFLDAPGPAGQPLNGRYDPWECFQDVNGNGKWDSDLGKAGQGGAHDAVLYKVKVDYPRLFPLSGLLGLGPDESIQASTVLRNQPFEGQTVPTVECKKA